MLCCIYCHQPLNVIRDMGYYYYCYECVIRHDVDVMYSYSEPHKAFSVIHLGFALNNHRFRVTISPFMQAMHVISLPKSRLRSNLAVPSPRALDYAVVEGHMRRIIHPHIHIDRDAKIFEMPWNYLYTPQNVKTKIKNLLIFS
jgi:hypothetical protein